MNRYKWCIDNSEFICVTLGVYTHVMEDMKRDAQKTIYNNICLEKYGDYIA